MKRENVAPALAALLGIMLSLPLAAEIVVFKRSRKSVPLDPARQPRLALLVARVGTTKVTPLAAITAGTDYAARVPVPGKADIWIEDEERARQALPDFPRYRENKIPRITARYYRNISAEIRAGIGRLLGERGFQVKDALALAASWETPLAEMTVGAIAARLRDEAEALLVFHYADQADFGYDSGPAWLEQEGFANIYCTAAAFDTASGTRFLDIKPDGASITHAIQHDPRHVSRVKVEKDEKTGRIRVSFGLTEEEIVAAAVEYLCRGTAYESAEISERIVWRGLDGLLF